jgi:lipoprotein-anchoring transpeptidase ErfK/SrfK
MDWLGYQRVSEQLAERFHMDEDFLLALNPGAQFIEGETITAVDPGPFLSGTVARIEVRKGESRLAAFDPFGRMLANYPVTIGSTSAPSPEGLVEVTAIAHLPTYHYDPENFVQGENTEPLVLPPGPNGPVGSVWIDLSKPTYGLHGTPEPSVLFQRNSHGCVRLTNWDVEELASLVQEGTVIEFVQ